MINKFIQYTSPPKSWKVGVILISGILTGMVFFVLYVGNATSYLSDDPETCINCHVMYPQYASWRASAHAQKVSCNDCHVPQDNVFRKYFFKASDGLRHSTMFTLRMEPEVIKIKQAGIDVVQENCIRCHSSLIDHVSVGSDKFQDERKCWSCHAETPHGTVSSLSSFPNVNVPAQKSIVPEWINKNLKK